MEFVNILKRILVGAKKILKTIDFEDKLKRTNLFNSK